MLQGDVPQISANNIIDINQVQKYSLGSLLIGGNFVPMEENSFSSDYLDLDSYPNAT